MDSVYVVKTHTAVTRLYTHTHTHILHIEELLMIFSKGVVVEEANDPDIRGEEAGVHVCV